MFSDLTRMGCSWSRWALWIVQCDVSVLCACVCVVPPPCCTKGITLMTPFTTIVWFRLAHTHTHPPYSDAAANCCLSRSASWHHLCVCVGGCVWVYVSDICLRVQKCQRSFDFNWSSVSSSNKPFLSLLINFSITFLINQSVVCTIFFGLYMIEIFIVLSWRRNSHLRSRNWELVTFLDKD